MIDKGAARDAILQRIRHATSGSPGSASSWESIDRIYIRRDTLSGEPLLHLFEHRITDYGAHVFHARPDQVLLTIEKALTARGAKRLLLPPGFPTNWLPNGFDFIVDDNLDYSTMNQFDGVLTTATAAIAATGSIVLQHGPGQGRRALTLIPDYHLCIVSTEQIVQTVPAAFARLDPLQPTTFISGPSATADIEMTRIKGVHGPRFMDVLLVSGDNA